MEAAAWAFQFTVVEFEADPHNPDTTTPKSTFTHSWWVCASVQLSVLGSTCYPADCPQKGYMLANKVDVNTATAYMTRWIKEHDQALNKAKE